MKLVSMRNDTLPRILMGLTAVLNASSSSKDFADAETLNVALTKDLAVLRQEQSQVLEKTEELEMEHNSLKEGFEFK